MRRFDYHSYITPDDPKELRRQHEGKFRTEAVTLTGVAEVFAGDDRDTIRGVQYEPLADSPFLHRLRFKYRSASSDVYVEMQEVAEATTHPLTREGFVAWAENRVRSNPVFEGSPNTVELELAGALYQVQVERLHDLSASELRAWLADTLWIGQPALIEKCLEELLREIEAEIIELADDEFDTVEDALE
ncbi:MAG: hypothetical protein H0T51_25500 [Pirellulales bacterium]|nr:hypothetical protein [Pirellulales bacterium]